MESPSLGFNSSLTSAAPAEVNLHLDHDQDRSGNRVSQAA
jgi:hypothetical protein